MKYAFMSFSCPQLTLAEILDLAARLGYDGIEPRAGSGHRHGVELEAGSQRRQEIRNSAAASGISLCCLAVSCRYADPATVAAQVDETRRYIDLAADVGAPRLRVFGGPLPAGVSRQAAADQMVQALGGMADHAARRGVTLCLETHDDWSDPRHLAEVLRRLDHPAVAANWDVMHPVRAAGLTMDQAFQILQPWIAHVHVHDGLNRLDRLELAPIGQGDFDHRRAVELLSTNGYDGYLSGEWIDWEPYAVHLPRELAALQRYEQELA